MFLTSPSVVPFLRPSSICCRLDSIYIYCRISFKFEWRLLLWKFRISSIFRKIQKEAPFFSAGGLCINEILSCRLDRVFISWRIVTKFEWNFTLMKVSDEFYFQKIQKGEPIFFSGGGLCKNSQILSYRLDTVFISWRITFKFDWRFTLMKVSDGFDFQKNIKWGTILLGGGLQKLSNFVVKPR